ncbi:ABC transporter ATP-binding protein [Marinivivus vitaminiproducens]|uniref:ABC transporter ATP-binding protein n=1 Tax=Marinivivus vitaminiproducens TaxID=3035935 RepID=UPI0027A287A5|nr:ABC transporter ATP-binding protein [Geminicoccaceae bacterium SCSIO 64248]
MEESLLSAIGVGKRFGGLRALDAIDLEVPKGRIHAVIGPNGAGKTTFFNCLTSFVHPSAGEIWLNGERIDGLRPDLVAVRGVARTYQNIRLFPDLTALENIMVGFDAKEPESILGALFATRAHRRQVEAVTARANDLLRALGLAGRGDRLAKHLAYGEQRRLEIARALAIEPVVLLLDEPAAGMNPVESHAMMELIGRLRDAYGLTILLIEHQMRVVMGISERISVLDHGALIAEGTPEEIRADPTVIAAYLGARAAKHGMDALKTGEKADA